MNRTFVGSILILISVFTMGYTIPMTIAYWRKKDNLNAITALNLVAGWTLAGWIIALVWSLIKDHGKTA